MFLTISTPLSNLLNHPDFWKVYKTIMGKEPKKPSVGKLQVPQVNEDWTSVMTLQDEETPVSAFICNWDYNDGELSDLLFLADQPSDSHGNDMAGKEILVKWWICTKIEIPDRQVGGTCQVVRSVLISPDRETLSTLSVGILKSIELLRRTFGTDTFDPPVPVKVIASKMTAGSDMLTLVPTIIANRK